MKYEFDACNLRTLTQKKKRKKEREKEKKEDLTGSPRNPYHGPGLIFDFGGRFACTFMPLLGLHKLTMLRHGLLMVCFCITLLPPTYWGSLHHLRRAVQTEYSSVNEA